MAEVLLSPGVLARENDQSFLQAQPVQAGSAIIGPTVKGPVGIPTLVTTYSQYQNKFGAVVESGSAEYTYFTSISAYNYFQQGGDSLLVTRVASGSYTSAVSTAVSNSLDTTSFVLETLSEGTNQNSTSTEGTSGQLPSGSVDNIRWEITSPNLSTGTFALLIRRGDDITTSKSILETWPGLSLDPNASNYIEKVIGNSKQTVAEDNGEYYIKNDGTYNTLSNYVRVKSVNTPTLNYFDNAGIAKDAFTGSIPVAASGTFGGAVGTPFTNATTAKFYDTIDLTNTQGFDSAALTDTSSPGTYTVALNLLANQDLYSYNLITAPGLIRGFTNPATLLTTMVTTAQTRGDNLAIIDLVKYDSEIAEVTSGVTDIDSSYATTYWPWLQTIDPDRGGQVCTSFNNDSRSICV